MLILNRMAYTGRKMTQEWVIENIKVMYSRVPNKFFVFKVEKWLDKNQKMNAIIVPDTITTIDQTDGGKLDSGKRIYHISVITGNVKFAGTDARVFIEIIGSKGPTQIHRLHNSKGKNEFERGRMDHFHVSFFFNKVLIFIFF